MKEYSNLARRYEGRLFVTQGILCFVTEVNVDTGQARISFRDAGQNHVKDVPIADIREHLSNGTNVNLDGLNSPEAAQRVIQQDGEWYFVTREGQEGPFPSEKAASDALHTFLLKVQSAAWGIVYSGLRRLACRAG